MHPELVTLDLPLVGRYTVTSYGAMVALAFVSGWWVIRRQLAERGEEPDLAGDVVLGAVIGGLVGAKLHYVVLNWWVEPVAAPWPLLLSRGGLVWYGGLFGGAAGAIWMIRRRGADLARTADATAPALALGYGIGRVGCFLVGDDYGRPTESWFGVAFPEGAPPTTAGSLRENFMVDVPSSVPPDRVMEVIPTQPVESGLSLLIFLWLWRRRDHGHAPGWLFGLWMVLAGVERFGIEFLRAKDDRILGPLTTAQAISLGLIVAGFAIVRARRRTREQRSSARTPAGAA